MDETSKGIPANRLPHLILVLLSLSLCRAAAAEQTFIHPGLLHSRPDLERMKANVAAGLEPWKSGFEVFKANPQSQADWKLRGPMETVGRNPTIRQSTYDQDANAAYQCAIMSYITGDSAYANKSKEIINAWSSTLKSITGRDAVLMAGLGPFKMVNAAEIIRYTNAGWSDADIRRTEQHFREVVYPVLKGFAPFANGNWDTAAIKTVVAIGVFCNDRAMFERGLRYYVNGAGNGRLTHYIINETGQCQESGRDMAHTQLGLAHLGDCCEIAWNQGLNLYAYADNRLLKGFEYTAKYNLGEDVPFTETLDRTGKYHHTAIAPTGRGRFRAVFEQIYNHYVNRMGIPAPYTQKVAERIRPEGPGLPGADHPGFGTLLFFYPLMGSSPPAGPTADRGFRISDSGSEANPQSAIPNLKSRPAFPPFGSPSLDPPAAPGAIVAQGSPKANTLTWVASVGAATYAVKRATTNGGPYTTIAKDVKGTTYTDTNVTAGQVYYYVASASNAAGESPDAYQTGICAGLPSPGSGQDIGPVALPGAANSDGRVLTMEAAGTDIGGTSDQFHFAYEPRTGDGRITARFVPQASSQFSKMGLMMREALAADAAHVSLLLGSEPSGQIGAPGWNVRLVTRDSAGADTTVRSVSPNLAAPTVMDGRLVGYCWLRLERSGSIFTGSISTDGQTWTQVGSAAVSLKDSVFTGLAVCSRLTTVTTTVSFDNLEATSNRPIGDRPGGAATGR